MLDVIENIDATVLVALIGVLSVVISAAIGAIVSRWHTASKFREEIQKLRFERLNEQDDSYLKNAREQIGTVYVPMSAELAAIKAGFQHYLYQNKGQKELTEFIVKIDKFIAEIQALELRGATAYYTTDLEELLIKFIVFLRASKTAVEAVVAITYDFNVGFGGFHAKRSRSIKTRTTQLAKPNFSATISAAGIGAQFRVSDIIQAPIHSEDFQARFERDTHRLSVLIKEVTLGSAARKI